MADAGIKVTGLKEKQRELLRFKNFLKLGKKEIWSKIGDKAIDMVRKRTVSGKDIKGSSFKSYSPAYASKKGSLVDLSKSGKMLKAISKKAWAKRCRIYVKATKRKGKIGNFNLAVVHNFGTRKMPKREFMGLTSTETKKLKKYCRDLYYKEKDKIFK